VEQRTAKANQIRGLVAEYGLAAPKELLRLHPSFGPRRHRTAIFIAGFVFFTALGMGAVLVAQHSIESGAFHLSSRKFGDVDYRAAHQPLEFWTAVAVLYCVGVYLAGLGLAGARLFLRKSSKPA